MDEQMDRLTNLIQLELGERHWMLVYEAKDHGSGLLSSHVLTKRQVIAVLRETTAHMKKALEDEIHPGN